MPRCSRAASTASTVDTCSLPPELATLAARTDEEEAASSLMGAPPTPLPLPAPAAIASAPTRLTWHSIS